MLYFLLKIVVLFLFFGQIAADVDDDEMPPEKDPQRPSMYWWINATKADEQLFDCFYNLSLPDHVSTFLYDVQDDVFREENSTNIRRLFNVTMLDWYCEFMTNLMQCVDRCPDGRWKNYVPKFYMATNFVCNESDFIERSKCFREVYESDVDQCESGEKCLPYKISSFHLLKRCKNGTYSVDGCKNEETTEIVRNMLQYVCDYIICGNRCRQEQLVGKCSDQGNKILLEFYRRVISSFKNLITFMSYTYLDTEFPFRDNCEAI